MDMFEKLGATVKQKGKEAAEKAREVAGIAQLKLQINTQEDIMKKYYLEIGKLYFELYGDMDEEQFKEACEGIREAKKEAEALRAQLDMMKK